MKLSRLFSKLKNIWPTLRWLDYVLIFVSFMCVTAFSLYAYGARQGEAYVFIRSSSNEWIYPLDSDREFAVPGPLGDTVVRISATGVSVLSSPCPEQICVRNSEISQPGHWIACLPNKVMVSIDAKKETSETDTISF